MLNVEPTYVPVTRNEKSLVDETLVDCPAESSRILIL